MPAESTSDVAPRAAGAGPEHPDDRALLRAFVDSQDEAAFAELTRRHVNWVYTAALRQAGSHSLAQDATQAAFIILARKAAALRRETILSGWLFRAVRYAVRDSLKIETRRQRREQEAATMQSIDQDEDAATQWEELAPLLDEALAKLPVRDRNAVLLRFMEQKNWREVGAGLGLNENAARVRTVRALEKLRAFLGSRGVSVSVVALTGLLLSQAVQAAPANVVSGLAQKGAAPISALTLVQAALRRATLRRVVAVTIVILLLLLMGWLALDFHQRRAAESVQRAAAIEAAKAEGIRAALRSLDQTYTFNDLDGFVAQLHFRNPNDEQFRPVLTNYLRASTEFRNTMRSNLRSLTRPWQVTFNFLVAGQSPALTKDATPLHFISTNGFGSRRICLVQTNGSWHWDLFHGLTPAATEQRMAVLNAKAQLLDTVTARVRAGQLTNATEALDLLQTPTSR